MSKIYLVGGAIRDEILGLSSKDKDYVVECGSFVEMRELIIQMGGKIFLEHEEFLTIRANVPTFGSADYVLARQDGEYSDGRRPDKVMIGTIFDDLARRDFTINSIARETKSGELIDPHGGQQHIRDKVIACVGNPVHRFNEDKLRIFRAMRFSITKKFVIHGDTSHAMRQFSHEDFAAVSTERIREELLKMFAANSWCAVSMLEEFNLIPLIEARGIWLKPTTEGK